MSQVLSNMVDFGMDPQMALDAPRFTLEGVDSVEGPSCVCRSKCAHDNAHSLPIVSKAHLAWRLQCNTCFCCSKNCMHACICKRCISLPLHCLGCPLCGQCKAAALPQTVQLLSRSTSLQQQGTVMLMSSCSWQTHS